MLSRLSGLFKLSHLPASRFSGVKGAFTHSVLRHNIFISHQPINQVSTINALHKDANNQFKLGRYEQAIKKYDGILRIEPRHVGALCNKGFALQKQGHLSSALKFFNSAIAQDEKCVSAILNKGNVLFEQGQYGEAISCYDQVIRLNDKHVNAYLNKGRSLARLNKFTDAESCFKQVRSIDSKAPGIR